MTPRTQKITLSAMFVALGVLFPILFHAAGLGSLFLPMFWPVAAAGFFLPVSFSLLVGVLTPVLSFLLTGMPPPPILQIMIPELAILAFVTCILYRKAGLAVWPSLFIGLAASRVILFLFAGLFGEMLGLPPRWASAAMLIKSLPGVIAILVLVPPLAGRLKHETVFRWRKKNASNAP
jgi:hypothetical protein